MRIVSEEGRNHRVFYWKLEGGTWLPLPLPLPPPFPLLWEELELLLLDEELLLLVASSVQKMEMGNKVKWRSDRSIVREWV